MSIRSRSTSRLALPLIALAVALIAAIVVGVLCWNQYSERSRAASRDAAVDGARQAIVDVQTFDTANIEGTLNRIGSAMTGDLRKQWDDQDRAFTEDRMKERSEAGFRTEPIVVASSPTEVDTSAGTVKVLVYMVQKFFIGGKENKDAYRWTYLMTMSEVDGRWKASAMTPLQEGGKVGSADPAQPGSAPAPTAGPAPEPAPAPAPAPAPTEGGTP